MSNAIYDPGREGFLDGSIDWDTDDVRTMLVRTAQAFSAAHRFVSDLTGANIVARGGAGLASKTVTGGTASSAGQTHSAVASGSTCNVVLYKYNASDAAARLIAFFDTGSGLPVTTNGADITVNPNASGWFKL